MAQVAEGAEDLGCGGSGSDDSGDENATDEVSSTSNIYFTCMVCMTTGRSAHVSHCGHHFCDKCIRRWMHTRNRCPYCQAFVGKHTLIPINMEPTVDSQIVSERRRRLPQENEYRKIRAILPEIGMFQRGYVEYPMGRRPRFKPLPPQMLKDAPKLPIRCVFMAPNLFQRAVTIIILAFLLAMFQNTYEKE
ncbi:E3 ubiquitin-protein ligase RNF185 [Drosophila serrata]|uniref:E3 ubiquitin-protein ligase RNF185 n=1 Tax=Drosophila serrata TaxID=7274 RepID=UPI000A1CF686|nr:E3 ubiquitin-protein ligase RNF185 [Drosophila serrata]